LIGCRITNAVKCVPPENKPETGEIVRCNDYLKQELAALPASTAILALGLKASGHVFAHDATHPLPGGRRLYDSYHCSRYNTQTRRLTPEMFRAVFAHIAADQQE